MLMLPTVVRNLFGGPATRMYPVTVRETFVGARGQIVLDATLCDQCGNCSRRCPSMAIDVDKEKKTWTLWPDRCIICEVCAENCNRKAISVLSKWRTPFYTREPITINTRAAGELIAEKGECPVEE